MSNGIGDLKAATAANVGQEWLTHIRLVAPAEGDARVHAVAFSPLTAAAQQAQDDLIAAIAAVARATAQRKKLVREAWAAEKKADTFFSGMCDRLKGEIKEGTVGADVLLFTIAPDGSVAVTILTGHTQAAKYRSIRTTMGGADFTANPAYFVLEPKVPGFWARLDALDAALKEKDAIAAVRTAAITHRNAAHAAWEIAFGDLIHAAERLHGADSDAVRSWLRPLLDLKAAQDGAATRRTRAAPPADVVDEDDGG